jgi:hypothetical protein
MVLEHTSSKVDLCTMADSVRDYPLQKPDPGNVLDEYRTSFFRREDGSWWKCTYVSDVYGRSWTIDEEQVKPPKMLAGERVFDHEWE